MKYLRIISALSLALFCAGSVNAQDERPAAASTQDYKMGVGVRLSSNPAAVNNSITFKYFLNEQTAIEALLSFGDPVAVGLLFEKHRPLANTSFRFFYGGGGYVSAKGPRNTGLQGIAGLDYKLPAAPINFSLDWKPELNVWHEFSFEPAALGLSARFTF